MHEKGLADHELVADHERDRFAGTSAVRDNGDGARYADDSRDDAVEDRDAIGGRDAVTDRDDELMTSRPSRRS